jgi:LysM repeat protein/ABC-type branched-subunit amino acid transport system substrate-binding protein
MPSLLKLGRFGILYYFYPPTNLLDTMKIFFSFCLLLLFFLNPELLFSQTENQKEVEISGVKYVLHTVKKSETSFSICQKYKVTQAELQKANPGLSAVLQAGSTIKIPVVKVVPEPKKEEQQMPKVIAEEYYYHKVAKKQTLFSITKQYGVTENDLIRNNPELTKGLVVGQVLKIPVNTTKAKENSVSESAIVPDTGSYLKYKVESGETLYSLSTRFGVEVNELKKANPSLFSRSLESGETILIPQQSINQNRKLPISAAPSSSPIEKTQESESLNCKPIQGKNDQKYKAALLLPLYLPGNDQLDAVGVNKALLLSKISLSNQPVTNNQDTTSVLQGMNIDQKAVSFLEFYEGALLAIDSLQRSGMNIELYVFDVTNQQMINSLLQLDEFLDLNLIIGPVYPELQETVASFAAKNRIPMISPLSPSGSIEQNNSCYFKVSPGKDYQIEQTAIYIADEFSSKNFILLQINGESNSSESKLAQLSKEKLMYKSGNSLFHEYNFQKQGVNSIKSILDENGENIFLIPTENEAQVSIAITNLTALAENYNIVLMGTPSLTKMKSLQTENFHRIRLRYLTPYFIDYNKPLVRRFVTQYRETFLTEPSQFSFQGFDVSYYFLSALYRFGKDFRVCLPDYPMELTQMDFAFRKVTPLGGFVNHSLFVNSYERNFDILNFGLVGH